MADGDCLARDLVSSSTSRWCQSACVALVNRFMTQIWTASMALPENNTRLKSGDCTSYHTKHCRRNLHSRKHTGKPRVKHHDNEKRTTTGTSIPLKHKNPRGKTYPKTKAQTRTKPEAQPEPKPNPKPQTGTKPKQKNTTSKPQGLTPPFTPPGLVKLTLGPNPTPPLRPYFRPGPG